MAETSATCGGTGFTAGAYGPLREGAGPWRGIRLSANLYSLNGTSTANKIITKLPAAPGDIVLPDRNCHQSHHYGMLLAGAQLTYLEAYPLTVVTMYGAVPARDQVEAAGLESRRKARPGQVDVADELHLRRDRLCVEPVMEECLAIKPICVSRTKPGSRSRVSIRYCAIAPRWRRPEFRERLQDKGYADVTKLSKRMTGNNRRARRADQSSAASGSGKGPGSGLRDPVDPQNADVVGKGG